jgi:predicted MPP superfamily phosphohydrolase
LLAKIKAKDGVFSVLGNHDYAMYVDSLSDFEQYTNLGIRTSIDEELGWNLLLNGRQRIRRGEQYIVIAGMENDGDGKHFPQKGDIKKALKGVGDRDFILMLEHDPSSWRRKILPDGRAQLTLSGHTHKMQFALFGWCPLSVTGKEVNGWYTEDSQSLFVSAGLGGLIPFRFGAPGEIVVITLKTQPVKD